MITPTIMTARLARNNFALSRSRMYFITTFFRAVHLRSDSPRRAQWRSVLRCQVFVAHAQDARPPRASRQNNHYPKLFREAVHERGHARGFQPELVIGQIQWTLIQLAHHPHWLYG